MIEVWKEISGYSGIYFISNIGRVKSEKVYKYGKKTKILKQLINSKGYYYVNLYIGRDMQKTNVHRLVGKHFLKEIKDKPHINHIDGNKLNNHMDNLEWCTPKENVNHYYKYLYKGQHKGKKHKKHKLKNPYEILITNKENFKTNKFDNLTDASLFIGKGDSYFCNWVFKNKLIYHNKKYSWEIKRPPIR